MWNPFSFNGVAGYFIVMAVLFSIVMMVIKILWPGALDELW